MVVIYLQTQAGIQAEELSLQDTEKLESAVWIDLIHPTQEEEHALEQYLKLDIPTKKEVEEIEPSSRLYFENNALFMTATMVAYSESPGVKTDVVTFILTEQKLITVRYIELNAFKLFSAHLLRSKKEQNGEALLVGLLEATIDRLADILEKISHKFDETSAYVFRQQQNHAIIQDVDYKQVLQNIGTSGDLLTKVRESLISFTRLISFLEQTHFTLATSIRSALNIISKDVIALSDYASFLSTKYNFLLDATLGLINIEQNSIIKIFSVAAVIFLPPTLIASIYGMNFQHIPELKSYIGYPVSLILMFFSAWLPFRYFKKKKWL
ncbi:MULTISPECIES: magnesium/cobalt transporter CorA [Legionella]|uniref:Magnesium transport protein CorA n=1 Tax=Legionella septentrionalis TaxID=2498109 RepID=A0A3S1CLR7_9GAMM|nr:MULTISPECIES: magnesium/cobalt transporter CorA [Legionella]MCP0914898.1 magnesium/cobalt transporter CorA [Legionella sp. 27cVA30]RUQ88847.1 magnesium/cobalt transporter CorA [Legionella septentrionalis]RUR11558.1 magnesium/cobalt transporter CorA [Legionella septentrionalis]